MVRQPSAQIENNFSKGMITAASGMNFPQNAVTTASNCVFDYLGTVSRREGFDLEQGNVSKTVNWQGQAISSYLWHNVTGDNTTNIYVVQIGGKLYFYPVTITGNAISPQITGSVPLDFSGFSSQSVNAFLINPGLGTIISGDTRFGGSLTNPASAFDGITTVNANNTTGVLCCNDTQGANTPNAAAQSQTWGAYIGKNFSASPQKIGTATITGSLDLGLGYTSQTINTSQRETVFTYQYQSQVSTLVGYIASPHDFTGWQVTGNSTGALGTITSQTFTGQIIVGRGTFYQYSFQLQQGASNRIAFSGGSPSGEAITFFLGSTTVVGVAQTYSVGQVYTTLNQTLDTGFVNLGNTTGAVNPVMQVNLRGSSTAPGLPSSGTLLATSTGPGTFTSNNQTTAWNFVWFEVVNVTTAFALPANTDTGAVTTGGTFTIAEGTIVARFQTNYSAVSIQEETAIAEVQFFSPATSIGSPFVNNFECQYASGLGFLFVTHPWCQPFVVTFKAGTLGGPNTYSAQAITIQVRDFDGVDDLLQLATNNTITTRPVIGSAFGLTPSTNPLYNGAILEHLHLYNLENQGWSSANLTSWASTFTTAMPSNCDIWWSMKSSTGVFTPSLQANVDVGTTAAPKGSFIFDAFYIDRGAITQGYSQLAAPGAGTLGITHSNLNRPSTVAFFAGRAWYAGVNYPNFSNNIWFSQVLSPTSSTVVPSLGQCYQANDPTSSQTFDLLPTDGGVIRIPDCGTIVKLFPMQGALLVFATNGIWVISGSKGGLGFTANDYSINRLSTMSCLSGQSIVDVQGQPMFWTNEGIYTIKTNVQAGGLQIQSMTYTTIDSFYKAIPRNSKVYARGYYNPFDYTVQWIYRSTAPVNLPDDNYKFDSVLVFNTATGGFYPFTVSTGNVNIASIVVVETGLETDVSPINVTYTFKYFVTYADTLGNLKINIADMFSTKFVDWFSFDNTGQQYISTFTSGYKFVAQGMFRGVPDYIYFYVKNSPTPNSYRVQSIRDYGIDKTSGRWSSINLFTNSSAHYSNFVRRHRLRGRGLVLQYKVTSFKNDPFDILGWAIWQTAAGQP